MGDATKVLAALREALEKGTPGPWTFEPSRTDAGTNYQHIRAKHVGVADTYHGDPICFEGGSAFATPETLDENGDEWISARHGNPADASLITLAVNALPALLEVAEALMEHERSQLPGCYCDTVFWRTKKRAPICVGSAACTKARAALARLAEVKVDGE